MSKRLLHLALVPAIVVLGMAAGAEAQSYIAPDDADAPGAVTVRAVSPPLSAEDDADPGGRSEPQQVAEATLEASDRDAAALGRSWAPPVPVHGTMADRPLSNGRTPGAPVVSRFTISDGLLADGRDPNAVARERVVGRSDGPLRDGRPEGTRPAVVDPESAHEPIAPAWTRSTAESESDDLRVQPNPVRSQADVSFTLTVTSPAQVTVYDIQGRVVAIPFDAVAQAGVPQVVRFDASAVAPGTYVVMVRADGTQTSRTFQVVR